MPASIFVLGFAVFGVNTAEVMTAGLLPALARQFGVSIPTAGLLVSAYAAGMALGGPLLTVPALRLSRKNALLALFGLFLSGQTIGALAPAFWVLVAARILTAVAAGAMFGTAAALCAESVPVGKRARALSVVFGGLMLAQVAGVPLAALIGQRWGWRASFWAVAGIAAVSALAILVIIRPGAAVGKLDLRSELGAFANRRLWAVYATNALNIAAVYAAYSYLSPVFTRLAGFSSQAVPVLFLVYGAATLAGNIAIGRYADRHATRILVIGQSTLTVALAVIASLAGNRSALLFGLVAFGLSGLPLSSARAARVMAVAHPGPLVNTVNTSMLNVGVVIGSWLGGLVIDTGLHYRGPAWTGAVLALAGALSLAPVAGRRPGSKHRASAPSPAGAEGANCE